MDPSERSHQTLTAELRKGGITPTVEHRGKHLKMQWDAPIGICEMFVSATPSDRRAGKNALAVAKRLMRQEAPPAAVEPAHVAPRQAPGARRGKHYGQTSFVHGAAKPAKKREAYVERAAEPELTPWELALAEWRRVHDRIVAELRTLPKGNISLDFFAPRS